MRLVALAFIAGACLAIYLAVLGVGILAAVR